MSSSSRTLRPQIAHCSSQPANRFSLYITASKPSTLKWFEGSRTWKVRKTNRKLNQSSSYFWSTVFCIFVCSFHLLFVFRFVFWISHPQLNILIFGCGNLEISRFASPLNVTHDCSELFKRRCLLCGTEAAVLVSEYRLSLDVPVSVWRAKGSENMTMSTMVDTRNCLPVYEEMYLATPGRSNA